MCRGPGPVPVPQADTPPGHPLPSRVEGLSRKVKDAVAGSQTGPEPLDREQKGTQPATLEQIRGLVCLRGRGGIAEHHEEIRGGGNDEG